LAASTAAFLSAFLSYFLVKFVPLWGLSLIATSVLFLGPLVYKSNQEFIDHHLSNASDVINAQTQQVKSLASQHAARATESTKSFVGDYSAKAQEMIGSARGRSTSPTASAKPVKTDFKKESLPIKSEDFPTAPKDQFKSTPSVGAQVNSLRADEPLIST